ncbi:MAG: 4Fe-4S binding protein [Spirochaetales bacterium]|jgi:2-oxoglutarate ferredoxin oxidoreductase subunit delta|nr:4Fe-4S binding protein [Spirochaetales bacterium]
MAKGKVTFETDRCKGCGLCVNACPKGILEINRSVLNKKGYQPARIARPDECIGCAACALMCPDQVITVERE